MMIPSEKKKLAIIHYTAPHSEHGGVESVISEHTEHLCEYLDEVHLIFGRGGGGWEGKNVIEHQIPELHGFHPDIVPIQDIIFQKGLSDENLVGFNRIKERIKTRLCQILEENEIDKIIVHNIPSMPFNFPALVAINEVAEKCSGKMIYWIHDSIVFRDMYRDRLNEYPFTEVHYTHKNIEYVTITHFRAMQFAETEHEQFRIEDITVIPNGIDLDDFLKLDKHTLELKEHLEINHNDYIILVPVRVTPRKNIELAVYVVNELRNLIRTGNIKLLISGPPDNQAYIAGKKYMRYLKDTATKLGVSKDVIFCYKLISKERVRKEGRIIKWGISDIYNLADIVFVPSKEEGFGLPIIEAGASRKPLFCSRIDPFEELVRDNIEAYMFGLDEPPKTIAFRIHRFLISSAVDLNFRNVLQNFMWSKIVKNMVLPLLFS